MIDSIATTIAVTFCNGPTVNPEPQQPQRSVSEHLEPVAWLHRQGNFTEACMNPLHDDEIARGWTEEPLYTAPPPRAWVGLTDEEMLLCNVEKNGEISSRENAMKNVEAKLKEKNTRNGGCL